MIRRIPIMGEGDYRSPYPMIAIIQRIIPARDFFPIERIVERIVACNISTPNINLFLSRSFRSEI
jgi:hypothetical protein